MPARSAPWTRPNAALRTADAAVDLAQARLDKRTLVAPFDARAGLRKVSPGEFVTAGTAIVNLEQIDPLKVDFRVPELFLPAVAPGQRIALEIDAFPDQTFDGVVGRSTRWSTRPAAPSWCARRSRTTRRSCGRACSRGSA